MLYVNLHASCFFPCLYSLFAVRFTICALRCFIFAIDNLWLIKLFHSCYSVFASCCWVFLSCYSTVATQDDSSIIIAYCWLFPAHGSALRFASFYVIINVSLPVVSYFERVHEKHSVGTLWPRRNHSNNEKAPKARWVEGAGEANTQQCDTLLERSCTKKQCWCFLVLCGTD